MANQKGDINMESIKEILMRRDNMAEDEADELISQAKEDLYTRLENGETPHDICDEWFELEPDYIYELM